MQTTSSALAKVLLIPCFALSSCKETEVMKKEVAAATNQIKSLQDESASIDAQMIELRKLLPATVATEPLIKQFASKLAVDVVGIENEITRVKTTILEAQTLLDQAGQDLETLRNLPK